MMLMAFCSMAYLNLLSAAPHRFFVVLSISVKWCSQERECVISLSMTALTANRATTI